MPLPRQLAIQITRFTAVFLLAIFSWRSTGAAADRASIILPIEVVGENGTTASVTFEIPPRPGQRASFALDADPWPGLPRHGERAGQLERLAASEQRYGCRRRTRQELWRNRRRILHPQDDPAAPLARRQSKAPTRFDSASTIPMASSAAFESWPSIFSPVIRAPCWSPTPVHSGRSQHVDAAVARFRFDPWPGRRFGRTRRSRRAASRPLR